MGRYAWIIPELGVLGLLIYELVSIRRRVAADRRASAPARDAER